MDYSDFNTQFLHSQSYRIQQTVKGVSILGKNAAFN